MNSSCDGKGKRFPSNEFERKITSLEKYYKAYGIEGGLQELLEKVLARVKEETAATEMFEDLVDIESLAHWNKTLEEDPTVHVLEPEKCPPDKTYVRAFSDGIINACNNEDADNPAETLSLMTKYGVPNHFAKMFHQKIHQLQYQKKFPKNYRRAELGTALGAGITDVALTAFHERLNLDSRLLIVINALIIFYIGNLLYRIFRDANLPLNRAIALETQAVELDKYYRVMNGKLAPSAMSFFSVLYTKMEKILGPFIESGDKLDPIYNKEKVEECAQAIAGQIIKLRALGATHREITDLAVRVEGSDISSGSSVMQCEIIRRQTAQEINDTLLDEKVEHIRQVQHGLCLHICNITREEISEEYQACCGKKRRDKRIPKKKENHKKNPPGINPQMPAKKLTANQALEVLLDRTHINGTAKSFFGAKLYDEFLEILEDDEIFELDAMLLQGDISIEEMEEYLMILPSHHKLFSRLIAWADNLVMHITRNLDTTLRDSVNRQGRIKNGRGIVRMVESVINMVESFAISGHSAKRNTLVQQVRDYLGAALIMDIWYKVKTNPELNKYEFLVKSVVQSVDKYFVEKFKVNLSGIVALQTLAMFHKAYSKHKPAFMDFLRHACPDDENKSVEELEQDNANDFEAVDSLSYFRSIGEIKQMYGNVEIEIYGDTSGAGDRSVNLAFVKVSFPGDDPDEKLEVIFEDQNDMAKLKGRLSENNFNFIIDRHRGDLRMGITMITLDKQINSGWDDRFMQQKDFLKMKAVIFRMLREYLENKPEDLTRYFFTEKTKKDEPETTEQTALEPAESQISTAESGQSLQAESIIEPTFEPTYIHKPFSAKKTPIVVETQPPAEEEEGIIQDAHLDGAYSEEKTIAAIVRITGIPPLKSSRGKTRGKGSHVVVQGSNGIRFPLPNHSGKDMSFNILKRCLHKLQIPYSRFKSEY